MMNTAGIVDLANFDPNSLYPEGMDMRWLFSENESINCDDAPSCSIENYLTEYYLLPI
jgi:hypothetical protein